MGTAMTMMKNAPRRIVEQGPEEVI